jgi:galactokinase
LIDTTAIVERFRKSRGRAPRLFAAPGRVNLIGEHTDYNDGFVLPMAIDRRTVVAAAAREDRRVVVESLSIEGPSRDAEIDLDAPHAGKRGTWVDYVEGVARVLEARGHRLRGADLVLDSDVPSGAGLSSSAALEVGVGLALLAVADQKTDAVALALAAQAAEHEYVGTRCGIMDQYISALAREHHALLIDCRSLEPAWVPLDGDVRIVICDTKVKHSLATGEYNTRRAECEDGVSRLRERIPGIRALRDVTVDQLREHEVVLPDVVRRRCRHVVSENERTFRAAAALRAGDHRAFGELMYASHASLRDDYEVSAPELDACVEAARRVRGVFGARMTGGGFGGCTVNLVETAALPELTASLGEEMERRFGKRPDVFVSGAAPGAHELE